MSKKFILNLLFFSLCISLTTCKKDDATPACQETDVTMTINGEKQTFQATGRGIDMMGSGYRLSINLDRRDDNPFRQQTAVIYLPYKKTGKNVIQHFIYSQYINNVPFDGDFTDGEFECDVITNTRFCIYATFSGKLNDGNQEVMITDGKLSYQYETPFDN
jgi:hypothetical protein